MAALTAERDALLQAPTVKPTPAPAAAPIFTMPPAATSALAASSDMLASLGIELPSWKQVAFSGVLLIAAVMGAYIASPILASILVAGTATVTASGFALWVASALGYLIATWASFKAAKGVATAVGWLAQYIPAPAVLAAKA